MGFLSSLFSKTSKAERLYRQALTKAQAGEMEAAVEAYSTVLRLGSTEETRYSAIYNRGLAYVKLGKLEEAQADYQSVINAPHAPMRIKSAARDSLHRLKKRHSMDDV